MIQAVDRLRLIHNEKRKTVYILCGIPLDIPVDELVTWKQLTGDRRLADALAECDQRGVGEGCMIASRATSLSPRRLRSLGARLLRRAVDGWPRLAAVVLTLWRSQAATVLRGPGPSSGTTQDSSNRLGAALLGVVRRALQGETITHTKAARILGVSPSSVEQLLQQQALHAT